METKTELVSLSDIARIADTTKQAVNNWRKRYRTFPEPVQNLKSGPVWSRDHVEAWIKTINTIDRPKKLKVKVEAEKSLEDWLWDAACAIRGAQDAPKFKDYILPLVFVKRLCDVFDDEVNRLAEEFGSRTLVLKLLEKDRKLVRFYLPFRPSAPEKESTWNAIKLLTATSTKSLGQQLTDLMHAIAKENPRLNRIVNRIDYNNTTHGVRELPDDRIEILINRLSAKRLGLADVEPDIIGRSYEYLIRKFAEGGGQSAGEFFTPTEVGFIMARLLDPEPGMSGYDPNTGSAGLIIKMQLALQEKAQKANLKKFVPLKLYGQEYLPMNWAMANMNMVIHEMEGEIEIGDTMKAPKLLKEDKKGLKQFDRITSNPMWNQNVFTKDDYEKDEYNRFGNRIPPTSSADWGWMQHILASLKDNGRAAVILDTGAASRGSGSDGKSAEKEIRKWFVDEDYIEGVIYLPDNLFYNTTAPGIIVFVNKNKPVHLKSKLILLNASRCFTKGNPKNFIDEDAQKDIVNVYQQLFSNPAQLLSIEIGENRGSAVLFGKDVIEKNDYNINPSKYISNTIQKELLPVPTLVAQLKTLELEVTDVDKELNTVLSKIKSINSVIKNDKPVLPSLNEQLPHGWKMVPIGSLGKIVTGSTPKTSVKEYYEQGLYDFIAPVDIGKSWIVENAEKKVSELGLSVSRVLPKNAVLAVCIGSTIGKVGLTGKDQSCTNQQINAIICDERINNPKFIYYLLTYYNQLWKEAATPSPVPILTKGQFEKIEIPYTDNYDEQTAIVEILSIFERKLIVHHKQKLLYEHLSKSLLKELMCGVSITK